MQLLELVSSRVPKLAYFIFTAWGILSIMLLYEHNWNPGYWRGKFSPLKQVKATPFFPILLCSAIEAAPFWCCTALSMILYASENSVRRSVVLVTLHICVQCFLEIALRPEKNDFLGHCRQSDRERRGFPRLPMHYLAFAHQNSFHKPQNFLLEWREE